MLAACARCACGATWRFRRKRSVLFSKRKKRFFALLHAPGVRAGRHRGGGPLCGGSRRPSRGTARSTDGLHCCGSGAFRRLHLRGCICKVGHAQWLVVLVSARLQGMLKQQLCFLELACSTSRCLPQPQAGFSGHTLPGPHSQVVVNNVAFYSHHAGGGGGLRRLRRPRGPPAWAARAAAPTAAWRVRTAGIAPAWNARTSALWTGALLHPNHTSSIVSRACHTYVQQGCTLDNSLPGSIKCGMLPKHEAIPSPERLFYD